MRRIDRRLISFRRCTCPSTSLFELSRLTASTPSGRKTFTYAVDGLRPRKQTGGTTTYFVWDEQDLLLEQE